MALADSRIDQGNRPRRLIAHDRKIAPDLRALTDTF